MCLREVQGLVRIVVISDTHGWHEELDVQSGDVLIHCGDFEDLFAGDAGMLDRADAWLARQNFEKILCTGGNHDRELERRVRTGQQPLAHAHFLQESGLTIHGLKFWGAPWVPMLDGHAFFAEDKKLETAWSRIPEDVDVLITHTPPAGVLDRSSGEASLGCPFLTDALQRVKPRLHCFGHVHAAAGREDRDGTTFVNATSVDSRRDVVNPPFVIDLE